MKLFLTFAVITLMPAVLLVWASLAGGYIVLLPLLYLTVFNHLIDASFEATSRPNEGLLLRTLPVLLAVIHFALMAIAIWAIALKSGPLVQKIILFLGFGLYFAIVSNAVGHELIHSRNRWPFRLGKWLFISHLFGHHTSSHRLVHHPYVATRFDPNSARYNEQFYRFWKRAWLGSFTTGLAAENVRRGIPYDSREVSLSNPYFTYILGAAFCLGLAAGLAGIWGLVTYIGLAFMAQTGLIVTDYVQHYGLTRIEDADGKFEPVGTHHSWNAPHWFTKTLTLNAPLHSDHHMKPAKTFGALQTFGPENAPQLPYSPGIMSLIALRPNKWRALMNPRVAEIHLAQRQQLS